MLAVIVCSLFSTVMLIGLATGIAVGFWRGRVAIGDALAFDPLVTPQGGRRARWTLV